MEFLRCVFQPEIKNIYEFCKRKILLLFLFLFYCFCYHDYNCDCDYDYHFSYYFYFYYILILLIFSVNSLYSIPTDEDRMNTDKLILDQVSRIKFERKD